MWGQATIRKRKKTDTRIIPTRVGTSCKLTSTPQGIQDHPHACGDKQRAALRAPLEQGSSPRVWGQDMLLDFIQSSLRIIPTRVGTSQAYNRQTGQMRDHPHACGDKISRTYSSGSVVGSSPRVWGQVSIVNCLFKLLRIIPTRVGTSILISGLFCVH